MNTITERHNMIPVTYICNDLYTIVLAHITAIDHSSADPLITIHLSGGSTITTTDADFEGLRAALNEYWGNV